MKTAVTILMIVAMILLSQVVSAQPLVLDYQKISDTQGGFTGVLNDDDSFGRAVASLGDLDDDGIGDIAVGALWDDDGGDNCGAVWILFLNGDGTVKDHQKISNLDGGFTGNLSVNDGFGTAVAGLGDLDGDGVEDIAVGATGDDDGAPNKGAVWILFLNSDGTVKGHEKISGTTPGLGGLLNAEGTLGESVANIGDFDGDGVVDIVSGASRDNDGGSMRGAVWILLLNPSGTVKGYQKISDTAGGFAGVLDNNDRFGAAVACSGDLDGDGVADLAVGAMNDDDGGLDRGAVWILLLNSDGTVKSHQKISSTQGLFAGILDDEDHFARTVAAMGDLDGDGVTDIAAGTTYDDDGFRDTGAVWVLYLHSDGTVKDYDKISATQGGFTGHLDPYDRFGASAACIGDLDNDGFLDMVVGARNDDDGGVNRGAVWIMELNIEVSVAGPGVMAREHIRAARDIKLQCLELLAEAIENELLAQDYLDEMLESGEYEGLSKNNVIRTTQDIHTAIQHEEQAEGAVDKSINKLDEALETLANLAAEEQLAGDTGGTGSYNADGDRQELTESVPACWRTETQGAGDVDGDGDVDASDWSPFRDSFGGTYWSDPIGMGVGKYNPCCDFNRDGSVDVGDWPIFRDNFGTRPSGRFTDSPWPPTR